jgi:putative tryptophan/tyrosine transport system substrate-binding protein
MRRREFIAGLGGAAASSAWPQAARAQPASFPTIGFLNSSSAAQYAPRVRAFQQGLAGVGYFEGRNVFVEYHWANDSNDRIPSLTSELVRRNVAVIAAGGTRTAIAAKDATTTIPVVFHTVTDPIAAGLVSSLSRPTGNLTGITSLGVEVGPKRVELLGELIPSTKVVALLINPSFPDSEGIARRLDAAAQALGLRMQILKATTEVDIVQAFAAMKDLRPVSLVISTDPLFTGRSAQLAALSLQNGIPAVYQYREFAVAGGLLSYGESFTESYRLLGVYAGRLLNGEKVANLPVQQSAKVELILNLKTAKTLGINVPLSLLGRADEVIE